MQLIVFYLSPGLLGETSTHMLLKVGVHLVTLLIAIGPVLSRQILLTFLFLCRSYFLEAELTNYVRDSKSEKSFIAGKCMKLAACQGGDL